MCFLLRRAHAARAHGGRGSDTGEAIDIDGSERTVDLKIRRRSLVDNALSLQKSKLQGQPIGRFVFRMVLPLCERLYATHIPTALH